MHIDNLTLRMQKLWEFKDKKKDDIKNSSAKWF